MAIVRLQTSLQDKTGMARDQYVTSLYYETPGDPVGAMQPVFDAIHEFHYGMATYYSPKIATDGHTTKAYLVGAPLETPPFLTNTFSILPTSGTAFPPEVACCMSMRASLHPGWKRQSTRGRIYLGPLNTSTADSSAVQGKVGKPFQDAVVVAGQTMGASMNAGIGDWVIYSKLHLAGSKVIEVSCDNAWDTQRSRGTVADNKSVGAVTG